MIPSPEDAYVTQRKRMVETQIRRRGISDSRVLAAMEKVPRHLFIPSRVLAQAYEDYPVGIGHGQTISQPYIVAFMTQSLDLNKDDKVLEIGTGCGYQSAILAEIAKEVYSVESVESLAQETSERLERLGYRNIHVYHADGFEGLSEAAPFDAVMVTAAPQDIPATLVSQLKTGGRMVIPVGSLSQELYRVTRTGEGWDKQALLPVRFVPMLRGLR